MKIGIAYKTIAEVRSFTTQDVRLNPKVYITDSGKEGEFVYDSTDTTSADNLGTVLVSGSARYKRVFNGDVYASWFINESDTTGTSGNRERNAIFRAYTYVAAQTIPQAVILDNSRIWYVNNDAIYLNIVTGKKITIKGEGNPVIDFLCTGAGDDSNDEAVFRTSNSWTYAGVGDVTFTGSISGTTLTVTAIGANPFKIGQLIYGSTILYGTYITGFKTGTGGTGTYTISKTQTLSSTAGLGAKAGVLGWSNGNRTINYGKIEIKGITFDGNRNPANAGSATVFSRPLLFRQCEEVNILNNHFQNIPGSALAIGGTDAVNVSDNSFKSVFARETTNDAIGDAISIYAYCQNARITNNDIKLSSGQSGRCGISVDDFCRNSVVTNNTIVGYERAIHIEACLGVQTIGNTIRRSPIGIISGINKDCSFIGNFIDGALFVANSTLAANALLFAYNDENSLFEGNTILGYKLKGESDYLAKFWGSGLIVKNNKFINVFDSSNQTLSINSLTIANSVSKTFTYATAPDLIWEVGERIRASKDYFYYMEGVITAVSSTSVTITVDAIGGSGTFDSWTLRYAAKGNVHGAGYNDDNEYEGNTFDFSNLEVSDNKNVIVRLNTLKSSYIIAQNTTNADINNNKHIPSFGEVYSRGVNAYGSVKSIITENTFTNPVEYVVDNGTSTGLVCQDNTYIRTDASSAGNGYWYVNSNLADTNVNRLLKPNRIIDYVNNNVWFVDNTNVAYEIDYATPEMFGARVNDASFNSGAAINSAIAFKKKVKLKAGTYYSTEKILINRNDFILEGEGKFNTVIQTKSGFSGSALVAVGSAAMQPYDVTVKNLRINSNASGTGTNVSALEIDAQYNIDIDSCWMQGGDYNGTLTAGVNVKLSKHLRFTSCNFTNGVSYGVMFSGAAYDDTMFNDCQFDENQVDIIVLSTGYIQRGNILGCSFGQSYVNGTYPTPVVNKNIYAGTASTIDYLSVINCDFFSSTGSSTDNAIDITSPLNVRISDSRFSNLKKYAIVSRNAGTFEIKDNTFVNNGRSRSSSVYTNATSNPDTSTYSTDIFFYTGFYGGSIEGNKTDQFVCAVIEPQTVDLQYLKTIISRNRTFAFQQLFGAGKEEFHTPQQYGATGNGSTNDTTALQTAFASVRDIYVPKGTYLINGEIEIFGNVYCEKDAIFKVAASYSGTLFRIKSKKNLLIDGLYIDATDTGITATGLKIEGLWNSTFQNYSFLARNIATVDTTSIGVDVFTSEPSGSGSGLSWGAYTITFNNPYIQSGNVGFRTQRQTGDTGIDVTHLKINGGWIGSQNTINLHLKNVTNGVIENVATDVIKLNTGIGYKFESCSQITLIPGEDNILPSLPDTAQLVHIDDATCSFIDIQSPRVIFPATITGTEFTYKDAQGLRFKPTVADSHNWLTEIRGNYNYGEPFVIEGKFGDSTLRKILKWDFTNLLTSEGYLVKTSRPRVQSISSGSTLTPNSTNDEVVNITVLATNVTIAAPSGTPVNGQEIKFRITDDATPRTITWNAIYRGVGLTLPSTTVALVPLYVEAVYNSWDVKWDVVRVSSGSIQFTGIQLNAGSAPSSPVNGYMYYDSSTNKFRGYANGAWVDLH